jgi:hypothetical protein
MKQSDIEKKEKENNFIYNSKVIFIYSLCITFSLAFNSLIISIFKSFSYENKIVAQLIYIVILFTIFIFVTNFFNIRIINIE